MFRKYYKEANDSLEPNRALIDEIFEKAKKKEKSKIYKLAARYGTAMAAVLVIAATAVFYPQIKNLNEQLPVTVSETGGGEVLAGESIENESMRTIVPAEENQGMPKAETNDAVVTQEKFSSDAINKEAMRSEQAITEDLAVTEGRVSMDEIYDVTDAEKNVVSSFLHSIFGERDEATQNKFLFEIVGKFDTDEKTFYLGRWRWWVGDHSSLLTEFVLDENLSNMYECIANGEGFSWTTENNFLEE
ncbi:MAG: hypothetical protein IJW15_06590 [Clostridia bacterium]|nr:hypothetical protein [Clostridia bacterium]